jgi:hypothetical protein
MNNWFYNEVEMKDKHKVLISAGANYRRSKFAQEVGQPGYVQRGIVFIGRHLVDAGKGLLDHYELAPTNEAFLQTASPD